MPPNRSETRASALSIALCTLCLAALASGCGTPLTSAEPPSSTFDGLLRIVTEDRGLLYVKPDHHIGGYDAFRIQPINVSYKRGTRPMPDSKLQLVGRDLRDQLDTGFTRVGIQLSKEAGECVLG